MNNLLSQNKPINFLITMGLCLLLATNLGCKKKDLQTLGAIIAIGIAAKVIYDMTIEHETQQVTNEKEVVNKYKKEHKKLPKEPTIIAYQSNLQPGSIVNPGDKVTVVSSLEVVRGEATNQMKIEEKIVIYDNEDSSKEIKSLTKVVNAETGRSGEFANEFKFTLPKGMPQGVYPIKTVVIIDGKESTPVETQMQLVMNFEATQEALVASL
ncbi:hypothetical protein FLL45_00690 [Aliikangiella marina]|uniref:Uncharacterized protein n=1 Tax=Aliikangiella marina TaxID=1712262 RepID=A0A545TH01_9GAMM|nr:hypothetical protein [Aliikangiella marina]TQV76512.1 hypothetical protein FLL45_00690 [Aliikangiella marina]